MSGNTHGTDFGTLVGEVNQHEYFEEKQNSFDDKIENEIGHEPGPKNCHVANEDEVEDNEDYETGDGLMADGNNEDEYELA